MEYFLAAKFAYKTPSIGNENSASSIAREAYPKLQKAFYFDSKETDAQYYTVILEDRIVFALRGSSSVSDFLADATFWKAQCPEIGIKDVFVHNGFYKQFSSLKFDIMATVFSQARKKDRPRFEFVGHSLGGALATLAAAITKSLVPKSEVSCVTFGSPRVGNSAFAAFFNEKVDKSVRYVNGNDAVTMAPRISYEHVAGLHLLGTAKTDFFSTYFGRVNDHMLDEVLKGLVLDSGKTDI